MSGAERDESSVLADDDASGDRGTAPGTAWGRGVEWVLLVGDRRLVATVFAAAFALWFSAVQAFAAVPILDAQALFYAYSGLIAGNLTLITVIVSINQLLLSRELKSPDELSTQIESVVEYREDVEAATGQIAPVKPQGFLRLLVEATREDAQRLGGFARDGVIAAGGAELEEIVTTITRQMDRVDDLLGESGTDIFSVLSLMLETNYAEQINGLRTIQATYADDFADVVDEAIDDLVDRLQEIDIARQYFKSIYIQQELATLSRILLYTGLPAVAVATATLLVLTVPASDPGVVPALPLVLPVTLTIGLLPLAILASFFLRAATITKLTAATLPFTTPEQEQ